MARSVAEWLEHWPSTAWVPSSCLVTSYGFRGGRNWVRVGFSRSFSCFSLPQISFRHLSILMLFISFHFISSSPVLMRQAWSADILIFNLGQRFSNYGPRTTCGPRGLSLWSFKKDRRKNRIQMNCVSHYSWKSQSLEMTHDNRLSLYISALQIIIIQFASTVRICTRKGFHH